MNIPTLPTRYSETDFRSRLEARWAIYFDLLDLEWSYEPEGFSLPEGNYCPDFYVKRPHHRARKDYGFYVEVKPTEEGKELVIDKLISLSKIINDEVFCVVGPPSVNWQWYCHLGCEIPRGRARFCHYSFCKKWGTPYWEFPDPSGESIKEEKQYQIAANYRFENGEAVI